MNLPHQYPFRFVDRADGRRVVLRASAGSRFVDPLGVVPRILTLEMLAQACFYLVPNEGGEAGKLALAGIDNARFGGEFRAGDEVEASGELMVRFGSLVRVRGRLTRGDTMITEAELLLARAGSS